MSAIKIAENVYWVGVKDPQLRIFDIVLETKYGTTYNSYLIRGTEKVALIDTVKRPFAEEFFANIAEVVPPEKIDYLVVNHTELDHSGSITLLFEKNPRLQIVAAKAAVPFVANTINVGVEIRGLKDDEVIDLGGRRLIFKGTPYMHWPDTMMEFLEPNGVLFSCDGFAAHLAADSIFADEMTVDLDHEIKFYYDAIMRPYAPFITKNMAKLAGFDVRMLAPSHGPIHRHDPGKVIKQYEQWSADKSEGSKQVTVFYVSAYGNTQKMAQEMAAELKDASLKPVLIDVAAMDESHARDQIEASVALVFGTPTFNGDAVRPVWNAVNLLSTVHSFGKKAAVFGSYGWSGEGVKLVSERLAGLRLKVFPETFRARLVPSDEDLAEVRRFTRKFADFVLGAA